MLTNVNTRIGSQEVAVWGWKHVAARIFHVPKKQKNEKKAKKGPSARGGAHVQGGFSSAEECERECRRGRCVEGEGWECQCWSGDYAVMGLVMKPYTALIAFIAP